MIVGVMRMIMRMMVTNRMMVKIMRRRRRMVG